MKHPHIHKIQSVLISPEDNSSESLIHLKKSFAPFATADIEVLILGSLPGDKSLELNQYYGHPQNKFWKTIATVTGNEIPVTYPDKKNLLKKMKIGIWDVTQNAIRKGSLDSAIREEQPNDLMQFISKHKKLRVIGFNGKKAEALYDKYFDRIEPLIYVSLPSTSPANAGISFEKLCGTWKQILTDK
jgi:hypoxanthine-DNA glycosylase